MSFLRRPQTNLLRRALFQVHLWAGLAVALYVVLIGTTGAALVFRPELQAGTFPKFFDLPHDGHVAPPTEIIAKLHVAYPDAELAGIDFPTYRRDSYLAYLTRGGKLLTVFSDPATGNVIGELPRTSWITELQDLHFDLLGGSTGRFINGIGAFSLVAMFLTGIIVWWPGVARWQRSLVIDLRSGWKRANWDLHSAVGFWLFGLLMVWAVTGVEFAYPQQFRAAVNWLSPLTITRTPKSTPRSTTLPEADPTKLAAKGLAMVPGAKLGRLVLPSTPDAPVLVLLAKNRHGDFDTSDEVLLYFDRYTGEFLQQWAPYFEATTGGDMFMKWIGPIHVGSFGGRPVRALWVVLALSFPLLAISGALMWWNRAVSRRKTPSY